MKYKYLLVTQSEVLQWCEAETLTEAMELFDLSDYVVDCWFRGMAVVSNNKHSLGITWGPEKTGTLTDLTPT